MRMPRTCRNAFVAVPAGLLATVLSAPMVQAANGESSSRDATQTIRTLGEKCPQPNQGSSIASIPLTQHTCNNERAQRFEIRDVGDGKWEIRTFADKCVTVSDLEAGDAPLVQQPCSGNPSPAQVFEMLPPPF